MCLHDFEINIAQKISDINFEKVSFFHRIHSFVVGVSLIYVCMVCITCCRTCEHICILPDLEWMLKSQNSMSINRDSGPIPRHDDDDDDDDDGVVMVVLL